MMGENKSYRTDARPIGMPSEMPKPKPCPKCGGELIPMNLVVDEMTSRPGLYCVRCGYEEVDGG